SSLGELARIGGVLRWPCTDAGQSARAQLRKGAAQPELWPLCAGAGRERALRGGRHGGRLPCLCSTRGPAELLEPEVPDRVPAQVLPDRRLRHAVLPERRPRLLDRA